MSNPITILTTVNAPIKKVWKYWTKPKHITKWAFASNDWEAPYAENDLKVGGKFKTTMAAKDGSQSFDFAGTYTVVENHKLIEYDMDDARHVKTVFNKTQDGVEVTQTFDPETENPIEMQKQGWQQILNNFKTYTENK